MKDKQLKKENENLDKEIKAFGKELEILKELEIYEGEDRVISSKEADELHKEDGKGFNLQSGIGNLDTLIGGFREGQLIVISAPTGMGKTSFAQTLTENFYANGTNCLWFSFEVGVREFLDKFQNIPLFYLPKQLQQNNFEWLEQRIKEGMMKYDTKVVFIDHLHYLIEMEKMAQAKSISLLVGMMMRDLKHIAIENDLIIFLISHMRKTQTEKKNPEIDDLRDSSFVAQESDMVLMMKRLKVGDDYTNFTDMWVSKNRRTGNLGKIQLELKNNKFYDAYEKNTDTEEFNSAEESPPQELSL